MAESPAWSLPRANLDRILADGSQQDGLSVGPSLGDPLRTRPTKVAIVSLLFNWPSTGGGTVHTAETARFLHLAGYEVRHFVIRYDPWQTGQIRATIDWPVFELPFARSEWGRDAIQCRLRSALDAFSPDSVIVTDSWSMKPRLAEACRGYPTYLRLAAQECLCPLNNVRMLAAEPQPESCPLHQLANPRACHQCVAMRQHLSGALQEAERALAGFTKSDYPEALRRAFADSAGVLVVNPLIAEACKPYARSVQVLPSGFDPARFPWTSLRDAARVPGEPAIILFAGLPQEAMKGFHVLNQAGRRLWQRRRDFRIRVTSDPFGPTEAWLEWIGWQSQSALPEQYRAADLIVCPSIAEEALGRTAVEAMGAWRPVVASRIGGFPFTVLDEATGVLCRPGDPVDLAASIERLLNDAELRDRLGIAGRRRFESTFVWPIMIESGYRPLLGPAQRLVVATKAAP